MVSVPEKVFKKWNQSILPQWKICFLSAVVIGLLAHFYKITNWLPNWDSLVFRYDAQNMLAIGRWFLPVVCSFSSFYDLPFLSGLTAIVFHALGAVVVCKMFDIEKNITAALIGAVIASFPTVTSVMMYNYVADGYSIAFFMSTLAAYYITREKPRYILAAVLLALSMGIYQAYITVPVMLLLMYLIDRLISREAEWKPILKKSVQMLFTGIIGGVLYFAVLKLLLAVSSTELLAYQGINTAASLSGLDLTASLYVMKETFLSFFFDFSEGINVYVVLNAVILVFTAVLYILSIIHHKLYQKPLSLALLIFFGIMLIPGACILALINASVDYHNLMRMGYVVFYLMFLIMYERNSGMPQKLTAAAYWSVLLIAVVLTANQVVIANVSYHKAQMAYEKSYGVLIRIADRIEQTSGADACDKLLVIGALTDSEAYSSVLPPDITGITDGYIIRADDETVCQSVLCSALNDYCGKNYAFVCGDEKKTLAERADVESMGIWPCADSIMVYEDTVIIKLGEEGES